MTPAASERGSERDVRPLGILAGGGTLPAEVAGAVRAAGRPVVVLALVGEASPDLAAFSPIWLKRGQLGRLFRACRQAGVGELVVIGGIRERRLPRLGECDLAGLWHVFRNRDLLKSGDDGVLRQVARLIEAGGIRLLGAAAVAPQLLAPAGALGEFAPSDRSLVDIAVGLAAAREHGVRDLGQGVVVANGVVVAREAIDGTDAMLARLAHGEATGGVLVKCLKPNQDQRFDMPAIGPATIAAAKAAGLAGIAVEADATLIAERAAARAAADAAGLFVYGARSPGRGA